MERYQYSPLQNATKQFRLLKLYHGDESNELKWDLETFTFEGSNAQHPPYGAISYVWGKDDERCSIKRNGRYISIPRTLRDALKRLRHESNDQYLWGDAICIDQRNGREKTDQILAAGPIYRNAGKVHVCLGNFRTGDNLTLLGDLRHYARQGVSDDIFRSKAESTNFPPDQWKSLSKMLKHPWFMRVWTLQEIGLAKSGTVYWAQTEIGWHDFVVVCRKLDATCRQLRVKYDLWLWVVLRIAHVDFRHGVHGPGFLFSLTRKRNSKVSMDRVRGVLGHEFFRRFKKEYGVEFLRPGDLAPERVDYAVAEQLLKLPYRPHRDALSNTRADPLYALSLVQHNTRTMSDLEHPSWTPRCTQMISVNVLAFDTKRETSWSAGGNGNFQIRPLSPRLHVLKVKGIEVDRIEEHSETITNLGNQTLIDFIWKQICRANGYLPAHSNEEAKTKKEAKHLQMFCEVFYLDGHVQSKSGPPDTPKQQMGNCLAFLMKRGVPLAYYQHHQARHSTGSAQKFVSDVLPYWRHRRFVRTEKQRLGLLPDQSRREKSGQAGDRMCVFFGGQVPFLLRPVPENPEVYRLCGECFIHGLMGGEAIEILDSGKPKGEKTFTLL